MKTTTYLYMLNYQGHEQELCEFEQRYLFGTPQQTGVKYRLTTQEIDPATSPFFRYRLEVAFQAPTLAELVAAVESAQIHYDEFKIHYLKAENEPLSYQERLQACRAVGFVVGGEANMHAPLVNLGLTYLEGEWYFGLVEHHDAKWQTRSQKPHSYSNSINNKVAKIAVNVACGTDTQLHLVDPCCGVGTVVIEALMHGVAIQGYEINPTVAQQAQENSQHFGLKNVIQAQDMHEVTTHYDVAIIDIPYGLYTPTTREEQLAILKTAKRIANRLVLLTSEDLDELIFEAGYQNIDTCLVRKTNVFTRRLSVCD
ncbi:MAG: TRM11 family SAM-dependent methyltransferase [Culicoidibacterales bacterium]